MKKLGIAALFVAALPCATLAAESVDVAAFVRKDAFTDIQISPTGAYYAATIRGEDNRVALAVISRADRKFTATIRGDHNADVDDFWWVGDDRVVVSLAQEFGTRDRPVPTGELFATNADGSHRDILVGQRVTKGLGSRLGKDEEKVAATLVDDLPSDERNVIVAISPFNPEPFTRAERLDVFTGRRSEVARAPVARATFSTDNKGVVRFASGAAMDNAQKLYYRDGDGADWKLVNDEATSRRHESAIGFSADDRIAYLLVENASGPDSIVAYDVASGQRSELVRDDNVDPMRIIHRNGTRIPVGVMFMDGKPRTQFFDAAAPEARLYRSLEKAFPGHMVWITSSTSDGRLALVEVASDRNPGDFYLYDTQAKTVDLVMSRRNWFNTTKLAHMQPISLKARDGLALNGYLTLPGDGKEGGRPMVVLPHGGPFGEKDKWGFDAEVQMLVSAGYAVLQVNFRGSGGYGRAFTQAGAREWGGAMQDDVTDATRWAIQEGIADPQRICIYGASYGAYASLMGVAKEPDLYRCAAGYVGVYDLALMQRDDARRAKWLGNWNRDWVGAGEDLAARSPTSLASRIKVPVFLAAGGRDERAPIEQTRSMAAALRRAGTPVEDLYYPNEGHGFHDEAHLREYYGKLLSFLAKHLDAPAPAVQAAPASVAR